MGEGDRDRDEEREGERREKKKERERLILEKHINWFLPVPAAQVYVFGNLNLRPFGAGTNSLTTVNTV